MYAFLISCGVIHRLLFSQALKTSNPRKTQCFEGWLFFRRQVRGTYDQGPQIGSSSGPPPFYLKTKEDPSFETL